MKDIIEAHWGYVEELLKAHSEDESVIKKIQFHYKTAFRHGLKHGKEKP